MTELSDLFERMGYNLNDDE